MKSPTASSFYQFFVTPRAFAQWKLMLQNDFTLGPDSILRVQIDGKGCDGFTYAVGFTPKREGDVEIPVHHPPDTLTLHMDPFSAFYLREVTLDFIQDFENDQEGFVVLNHHQGEYHGKFWVEDESKIPPPSYLIED